MFQVVVLTNIYFSKFKYDLCFKKRPCLPSCFSAVPSPKPARTHRSPAYWKNWRTSGRNGNVRSLVGTKRVICCGLLQGRMVKIHCRHKSKNAEKTIHPSTAAQGCSGQRGVEEKGPPTSRWHWMAATRCSWEEQSLFLPTSAWCPLGQVLRSCIIALRSSAGFR